jgi:prepilin-type N-terminal cleavage/methylation domain-containing protein
MAISISKTNSRKNGFALIEILIAMAVFSIVLLNIYPTISSGIVAMTGNKNHTTAVIIAKSQMNEFISQRMRGPDLKDEPVEDNQHFLLTRITDRFEHPLLGPLPAKQTTITVSWKEREKEKSISISYIFAEMR